MLLLGYRDYFCKNNIIGQLICQLNPQYPQESIKNFYLCLNENYDDRDYGQYTIEKRLVDGMLPLFNYTRVSPLQ